MAENPATPPRATVPATPQDIAEAAAARGLVIAPERAHGVAVNLALLARHARILRRDPE